MRAIRLLLGGALCAHLDMTRAAMGFRPEAEAGTSLIAWGVIGLLALAGSVLVWIRGKGTGAGRPGWIARRGRIQVLSGTPIGAGARLVEVRYRGRVLLLGVTSSRINLIEANEDAPSEEGSS